MSEQLQERRLLDWRFLAALIVLGGFIWIVATGIQGQLNFQASQSNFQQSQETLHQTQQRASTRINGLLAQIQRIEDENARTVSLQNAYLAAQNERLTGLLAYLQSIGVKIPAQFLKPIAIAGLANPSGKAKSSATKKASKPKAKGPSKSSLRTPAGSQYAGGKGRHPKASAAISTGSAYAKHSKHAARDRHKHRAGQSP